MTTQAIRSAVGDYLRRRSIHRHRSRIGWREAGRYTRYLERCRAAHDGPLPAAGALAESVATFTRDGVSSFHTPESEAIARAMAARIAEREAAGEAVWEPDVHAIGNHNYAGDLWRDFPEVEGLFRGPLGTFLENYFQAHYKILYGVLYRSVGSEQGRSGSQRWHSDSGPGICVNVMYYLHDTVPANGALQALPWGKAVSIYDAEPDAVRRRAKAEGVDPRGGERRRIMADYYDETIARDFASAIVQPTGPAGLVVPFLNNTLHRGGFPEPGHTRTAIVFHCYPSHLPTDFDRYREKGIGKVMSFPRDPAEPF